MYASVGERFETAGERKVAAPFITLLIGSVTDLTISLILSSSSSPLTPLTKLRRKDAGALYNVSRAAEIGVMIPLMSLSEADALLNSAGVITPSVPRALFIVLNIG